MILNDKYLSLPPFISTSWDKVLSLRFDGEALHIDLTNGHSVNIPSAALPPDIVEMIFKAHEAHLKKGGEQENLMGMEDLKFQVGSVDKAGESIKLGINPFEGMNGSLQHNPEMANAPDLPKELVHKISSITKIVAGEEIKNFPKGEPHCNCFYCQIARSLHNQNDEIIVEEVSKKPIPEEVVSDKDLEFQQWQIQPSGNQLFRVTNKLDTTEQYNVYLGDPVGCTCGNPGCEHIIAVLKS